MARTVSLASPVGSIQEHHAAGGAPLRWRTDVGRFRWLLLGTLGVATSACGGKSVDEPGGTGPGLGLAGATTQPDGHGAAGQAPVGQTPDGRTPDGRPTNPIETVRTISRCLEPVEDLGGGWERCANGFEHRREVSECPSSLPRSRDPLPSGYVPTYTPGGANADAGVVPYPACTFGACCAQDTDCTEQPHGYCEMAYPDGSPSGPLCRYGCVTDSECGEGEVCLCSDPVGVCVPARCTSDADCGGLLCTTYDSTPGCGSISISCQSAADTCASSSDCPESSYCSDNYGRSQLRSCEEASCTIGRPFLIDGRERLAPCVERDDWYATRLEIASAARGLAAVELPGAGHTDDVNAAAVRSAVSDGWLAQALMEHASVAAFARFALQLASLGAPPELLDGAASAMRDEIRHARACFALARRHGDREVGPGPLPLAGALDGSSLEEIVVATILEGCIGETVAAIEAAEARAACRDPEAREVLAQIERDETEHARLAWRFVQWALEHAPDSVRAAAARTFDGEQRAATRAATPPASALDAALLRHGLMPGSMRPALRQRVLHQVVEPCWRALRDGLSPAAHAGERRGHELRA